MKIKKYVFFIIALLLLMGCSTAKQQFFGVQSLGGGVLSIQRNAEGGITYKTFGNVNKNIKAFCTVKEYNDHLSVDFELRNNGNSPIDPNYFMDKYYLIDKFDRRHILSFDILGTSEKNWTTGYPSDPINPGSYMIYGSENLYTNVKAIDIIEIQIHLGGDNIIINARPY